MKKRTLASLLTFAGLLSGVIGCGGLSGGAPTNLNGQSSNPDSTAATVTVNYDPTASNCTNFSPAAAYEFNFMPCVNDPQNDPPYMCDSSQQVTETLSIGTPTPVAPSSGLWAMTMPSTLAPNGGNVVLSTFSVEPISIGSVLNFTINCVLLIPLPVDPPVHIGPLPPFTL